MPAVNDAHWAFVGAWLTPAGLAQLNDDYEHRDRYAPSRAGGAVAISRPDFAAGWIAAMVRCKVWSWFTPAGQDLYGPT
jgi:hypothetical protein